MKKIYIPLYAISCFAAAAIVAGCSDDFFNHDESSDQIAFKTSVSATGNSQKRSSHVVTHASGVIEMDMMSTGDTLYLHPIVSDYEPQPDLATRSSMVNSADEMYEQFYVSAYKYEDTWDDAHARQEPNYFDAEVATKTGSTYSFNPPRYWPQDGKVRFIAHAPLSDDAFSYYAKDDANGGPRVHIKIADKVADQNDLLVSYSDELTCNGKMTAANLNFKHALTGIRFTCDKSMPKAMISNITLKGMGYEGDFYYNLPAAAQSSEAGVVIDDNFSGNGVYDKAFSLDLNYTITGEDNATVTDGDNTFIMFPQTLPDDAQVCITLSYLDANGNATGRTEVITGSLAGRQWPAGKIVTYKISTSAQFMEVDEPQKFDYLGNVYDSSSDAMLTQNKIRVTSYAGEKNIPWTIQYQDEGSTTWSNTSSWLSVDPSWSWQDASEQYVPFVAKSSYNAVNIDNNLKAAPSRGTLASPYNLASATGGSGVENTANCYIISGPGYYMFPLVYGNAIKNSSTNTSAYKPTSAGSNGLAQFRNHLGAAITAPYIADNAGCTPDHASIVWQDANNLVRNVEYVASAYGGKGGLRFYVSPSTIQQGNAVISICDKSNVMWSWHIWATTFQGFDSTVTITNADNTSFTLMPVNLGWCSNGSEVRYYPARKCKVRFTPTSGDDQLAQEVTFVQESHTSIPFGNNPYYQWGRKDPFVGTNIAWGNKERWDGNGTYYGTGSENNPQRLFSDLVEDTSSTRLTTKQCLDLMIKNPDKWHNPPAVKGGSSYVSLNETYDNLWGDNTLTDSKTVYDPCPVGYQVNYYYTYTGFLDAGYNWTSDKGIEFVKAVATDWDTSNLAEFYTDATKLHSITFPVSGYRDWNDKAEVVDFKVRGFIWLRGLTDDLNAYMFRYAAHATGVANVAPVTMFYSTDGLPVRCGVSK